MQDTNPTLRAENKNPNRQMPARPMPQEAVDLIEVALLLLSHWWKIVICALLGAILAFAYSNATYHPRYDASAKLYVNNNNVSIGLAQVSISTSDISAAERLVETYQQFINSHYVLDSLGETLEEKGIHGYNYYNLAGRITTSAAGGTPFLNIRYWDETPENTITIINTLVEILPNLSQSIIEGSTITALDPAYKATLQPSATRKNTLKGGLAGAAAAAGLILLYYYFLNDLVTSQDWLLDNYSSIPSLGSVPDTNVENGGKYGYAEGKKKKNKKKKGAASFGENLDFFGREAYNVVRTNIKFSFYGNQTGRVVGVTSAMEGDGKSYTSVNLAYAIAKDNNRVLLIDGDMRKLTLKHFFKKTVHGGLSDILCGSMPPAEAIQANVMHENLSVLFSGNVPPNPSELLGSEHMRILLERLRAYYDYILIDLPPVSGVIDAIAVSKYLDGMVLIVRHDQTRKRYVRATIRQIEMAKVRLLGFVYNAEVEKHPLYRKYYRSYYSKYGYGEKNSEAKQD